MISGIVPALTANHLKDVIPGVLGIHYGDSVGPLAMIGYELRQARKGATVVADSCAGVWLAELPPTPFCSVCSKIPHLCVKNSQVKTSYEMREKVIRQVFFHRTSHIAHRTSHIAPRTSHLALNLTPKTQKLEPEYTISANHLCHCRFWHDNMNLSVFRPSYIA